MPVPSALVSIILGLIATCAAWALLWAIGESAARLLYGRRWSLVAAAARLPLGISVAVLLLEALGFFLPISVAAWVLLVPALHGATVLVLGARAGRAALRERHVVLASLLGLVIGLVPIAIAGRFTSVALTNNDATYYITAADRLVELPWSVFSVGPPPPDQCLSEHVLTWWNWRTGTPNLMAAVSALAGFGSPEALPIVGAVLFACVPPAVMSVARNLGVRRERELVVGVLAALSAAPAFLGYQHMTGHLAAHALFLLVCAALIVDARRGGLKRLLTAAIYLGAAIAFFADGAAVLVLLVLAVLVSNARRLPRALLRLTATGIATAVLFPFTIRRAAWAAYGTIWRTEQPEEVLFPQRGWLPRTRLDDLATVTGVDPWPPWPGAWPPLPETVVTFSAALAGAYLFARGARALRPRTGERGVAIVFGAAVMVALALLDVRYLAGKVLLMAAAFVGPLCAVGAARALGGPRSRLAVVPFVCGEVLALAQLGSPSRWHVVDRPAHDALVPQLARLPAGSLVAFDGLGAPADEVLDTQRAHRAALLADLRPVHPGLDGGFYRPICETAMRPETLPPRAYALQRRSSEVLTPGRELAAWDGFRLIEADLTRPEGFIAAWAPTHSWMRAEQEPGDRVFRWAEAQARGSLQVVTPAPCARLSGELRVVSAKGSVEIRVDGDLVFAGVVAPDWSRFVTRPFDASKLRRVDFAVAPTPSGPAPDPAHALAVGRLALEPMWSCGTLLRIGHKREGAALPIEFETALDLSIEAPAAAECAEVSAVIVGERDATLHVSIDGGPPTAQYMTAPTLTTTTEILSAKQLHTLKLTPTHTSEARPWRLVDVKVVPRGCP